MAILLDVYNTMIKEAADASANAELQERVEILSKYASVATELLQSEYPNDFTKEDVLELSNALIQSDIQGALEQEKQAEATNLLSEYVSVADDLLKQEYGDQYGAPEVEKLASTLYELDAEEQFVKEADAIAEFAFLDEFNKLAETNFQSADELSEALEKIGAPKMLADAAAKAKQWFSQLGKATSNGAGTVSGKAKDLWSGYKGQVSNAFGKDVALGTRLKGLAIGAAPLAVAGGGAALLARKKNDE